MALAPHNSADGFAAPSRLAEPGRLFAWNGAPQGPGPATMRIGFRTVDGVRIRCAESEGPAETTILLTSPWPESVYAFVPIWRALARRFRLFAIDLPGFGASEHRADLLSPQAMGAFLLRVIDECDLGRPHVVGPDIATAAALFAASSAPASVRSVVVGSGAAAVPLELGAPLSAWALDRDVDRFRATDSGAIVSATIDTISGHLPRAVRDDYLRSYAGERFFESMRYVRRYPAELPVLAQRLPAIRTPTLVFAGVRDDVVPVSNAEFLAERLPHCSLAILGAGHWVWEEAPDAFSQMISDWVLTGYRDGALTPRPAATNRRAGALPRPSRSPTVR